MRKKKILILGVKDFPSVKCYDWGEKDLPNISDHDVVILNVVSLTKNFYYFDSSTLKSIKSSLLKLLDSKGTIYAIACPFKTREITIHKFDNQGKRIEGKTFKEIINNYMWSPIPLEINNEKGDTIEIKDASFEEYFKNVKRWSFTIKPAITSAPKEAFDYGSLIQSYTSGSSTIMDAIATDRRGRAIAAKFYYEFEAVRQINSSTIRRRTIAESGDFILLPLSTEIDDIEAINYILEKHLGVFQKTPPPEWARAIQVPGLNKIQSELETASKEISRLENEKSELKQQKSELLSYRELLYETGHSLEEIVRKVFTELGYPPKQAKFGEEYIIEFNNTLGIIECKGVKKSISRRDFRQLLDYVKNYETEPDLSNLKIKGILIANAWRDLKPKDRNTKERKIFPSGKDGVINISQRHHIALVSTIDLFKVFCKYKKGEIEPIKIIEAIFKADGIVKFPT